MALVADSGGIYALYDTRDPNHKAVRDLVMREPGLIILPAAILAEVDSVLRVRLGPAAEARFLEGIVKGAYLVEPFTPADAASCMNLIEKYSSLDLGLADASVIAVADRLNLLRILTVDERDFRAIRSSRGRPFVLLPADDPQKK